MIGIPANIKGAETRLISCSSKCSPILNAYRGFKEFFVARVASRAVRFLVLFACVPGIANAQETRREFWPEFNGYLRLNSVLRLRFVASVTRARETEKNTEGIFEVDLDVGMKAFFREKLLNLPDDHRGKYVTLRAGYAYIPSFAEVDPDKEHRIVLEGTGRFPLPFDILLSERNRGDLRWINGESSARYRNRLRLERDFAIRKVKITPYATGELFYDFRVDRWNRNEISFGAEFPVRARAVIEFYFLRQHNSGTATTRVTGFGLVFQWHF